MEDRYIEDTRQPDEQPETVPCPDCGSDTDKDCYCDNKFCPRHFNGISLEMANEIVELREEVETLKLKLKFLKQRETSPS